MLPVLCDGDYVLTKKPRSFRPGLLYTIAHSDLGLIVKRLKEAEADRYVFEGSNPASTPSQLIAPVEADRIKGQVILVIGAKGIKKP